MTKIIVVKDGDVTEVNQFLKKDSAARIINMVRANDHEMFVAVEYFKAETSKDNLKIDL